jgi:hypothetical protein
VPVFLAINVTSFVDPMLTLPKEEAVEKTTCAEKAIDEHNVINSKINNFIRTPVRDSYFSVI